MTNITQGNTKITIDKLGVSRGLENKRNGFPASPGFFLESWVSFQGPPCPGYLLDPFQWSHRAQLENQHSRPRVPRSKKVEMYRAGSDGGLSLGGLLQWRRQQFGHPVVQLEDWPGGTTSHL